MSTLFRWPRTGARLAAVGAALAVAATASAAPAPPAADPVAGGAHAPSVEVAGQMPPKLARSHRLPLAVASPTSAEVAEALVTRGLDIPDKDWQPGHRVVDLRADPGAEVLASLGGTVSFAGVVAGTPVVTIDHRGGLHTTYEPVHAEVSKGERVARGQRIGRLADAAELGETARKPDGLSWGAWVKGADRRKNYLDPFGLLGGVRVRLLR